MFWNARRAVLADTGPLYAAVDPSDQYHDQAQRDLEWIAESGFSVVVVRSTLLEAHRLVQYRIGSERALAWLERLLAGSVVIDPTRVDYDDAVAWLYQFPDQSLTLFDVVLAVLSRRLDLPVWTFDHHFDVLRVPVWRR